MPNGAIIEFFKQGKCGIQRSTIDECLDVYKAVKFGYPDRIRREWHEDELSEWLREAYEGFVISLDLSDIDDRLEHGDLGWHIDNDWSVIRYADLVGMQGSQLEIDEADLLSLLFS